jgi:ribosomal protein S18 acetylase RimI-like enzyme
VADADVIGQLLHDFNTEYDDDTPGPRPMAKRVRELLDGGAITVLLVGDQPAGLAVLRFRPALWAQGLDCYLEELYVVPQKRGQGLGRRLMETAIDVARQEGAVRMDLGTGEDDVAARGLYESFGFTDRERGTDGPLSLFYEREL